MKNTSPLSYRLHVICVQTLPKMKHGIIEFLILLILKIIPCLKSWYSKVFSLCSNFELEFELFLFSTSKEIQFVIKDNQKFQNLFLWMQQCNLQTLLMAKIIAPFKRKIQNGCRKMIIIFFLIDTLLKLAVCISVHRCWIRTRSFLCRPL